MKVKGLSFEYNQRMILNHIDITIPQHQISIILGANGCGKSTLLKNMVKILKPTSGKVVIDNQNINEIRSKKFAKMVSLMPQSPLVPDGITVKELISRGRFPYRKLMQPMSKEDYQIIDEAMELMKISDLANRYVSELSGGQRQRVWIALALVQDGDYLFLDEPTTYLDIQYQIEILDLLKEINLKKGTTIVMVLHDINLAARYGDNLIALSKGKLKADGKPEDVLTPKLIKEVYGLDCKIINDPISNTPLVIPISQKAN